MYSPISLSIVWGEARTEACAPGEQPQCWGQWRRGGRWCWRLRVWWRVLGQSPLLWLRQARSVLRDRDGAVCTATQAPPHCDQELPSGQPEVNHTRRAVPEEGRNQTQIINSLNISLLLGVVSLSLEALNCFILFSVYIIIYIEFPECVLCWSDKAIRHYPVLFSSIKQNKRSEHTQILWLTFSCFFFFVLCLFKLLFTPKIFISKTTTNIYFILDHFIFCHDTFFLNFWITKSFLTQLGSENYILILKRVKNIIRNTLLGTNPHLIL